MQKPYLAIVALCLLPTVTFAEDVYDVLNRLPIQRPDGSTQTLDSSLYAASVSIYPRPPSSFCLIPQICLATSLKP